MKIVDINLLIHAINKDTPNHSKAKVWLEASLSTDEPFGFAWIVILGFLRIITNGNIMSKAFPSEIAMEIVYDGYDFPIPALNHCLLLAVIA